MEQGELIEEAAERAGLDPSTLGHRHITSIKRSLMLLFTEIEKEIPAAEYRLLETTLAVGTNQKGVELPADCVDVVDVMVIMDDGSKLPTRRISRQDYLNVNRGSGSGVPSSWWLSKSLPGEVARLPSGSPATDNMILVLWPTAVASVASVLVSYIRETTAPGSLGTDVDARREWWDTISSGLAARIAEKYNPMREGDLQAKYMARLGRQNNDMHPVVMSYRGFGFSRGRRH